MVWWEEICCEQDPRTGFDDSGPMDGRQGRVVKFVDGPMSVGKLQSSENVEVQ